MTTTVLPSTRSATGFRIDPSRGRVDHRVSSEWFSRPDDERYLSLADLHATTLNRAERATARTVESRAIRVEATRDNAERLTLSVPGQSAPVAPTTGPSGSCAVWSARHRLTCAIFRLRSPPSTCSTDCCPIGPNWSRHWKRVMVVWNYAPSPARIMAASGTMNLSAPCAKSLETGQATRIGRFRVSSTGRR